MKSQKIFMKIILYMILLLIKNESKNVFKKVLTEDYLVKDIRSKILNFNKEA